MKSAEENERRKIAIIIGMKELHLMMTKDISTVKLDFKTKIAVLSAILHSTRSEGTTIEETVLEAIEIDRQTNVQCNKIISKSKA